jgi:DNA-directed RNA polymerase specialized sigma24 family protein
MRVHTTRESSAHGMSKEAIPDDITQEFVYFYRSRKPRIFYYALSLVGDRAAAEDLTHDAFLRLFTEIKCGSPVRSALKWTHRVLRNLALNYTAPVRNCW